MDDDASIGHDHLSVRDRGTVGMRLTKLHGVSPGLQLMLLLESLARRQTVWNLGLLHAVTPSTAHVQVACRPVPV